MTKHCSPCVLALHEFDWVELTRFLRESENAFNNGQVDALAELYDESALLVADGRKPVAGRVAIREFWRKACREVRQAGVRRTVHLDQYDSCADTGYLQGTVCLTRAAADVTVVWFVTVWRRDTDRAWRIVADIATVVVGAQRPQLL